MLVLSRSRNQSIQIGDDITITVVEIKGGVARIGIDAPREVTVHRQEIAEAIEREKEDNK